jgi:hypothetical protein
MICHGKYAYLRKQISILALRSFFPSKSSFIPEKEKGCVVNPAKRTGENGMQSAF